MLEIETSLREFSAVSTVINKSGSAEFAAQLLDFVNSFVQVDHCTVSSYQKSKGVCTLFTQGAVPQDHAKILAKKYELEYFRDPNFSILQNPGRQTEEVIRLDLDKISDDDYISYFYTQAGIVDKVSTIVSIGKTRILSCFYRISPTPAYDQRAWQILNRLLPVVSELIINHYRLLQGISETGSANKLPLPINQFIHAVISREIGPVSHLTLRERDICERTLLGKTAKEIAADLHIAESTVITHRKRSYNKLGIGTHKELFTLFLGYGDED